MSFQVCLGAMCACSFGAVPTPLMVTPENRTFAEGKLAATIVDFVPMKNIQPFGMCSSMANPTVAAATAAALGVLTPMPCIPLISAPWAPGSPKVLIGNKPALNSDCKAICAWGGIIQITNPGSTKVLL